MRKWMVVGSVWITRLPVVHILQLLDCTWAEIVKDLVLKVAAGEATEVEAALVLVATLVTVIEEEIDTNKQWRQESTVNIK